MAAAEPVPYSTAAPTPAPGAVGRRWARFEEGPEPTQTENTLPSVDDSLSAEVSPRSRQDGLIIPVALPSPEAKNSSGDSSGLLRTLDSEAIELDGEDNWFIIRATVLGIAFVAFPCICRAALLRPPVRCGMIFLALLLINMAEAMPLYCAALAVPVMGTLCAVLGEQRGITETSLLLVKNIFNNTSFMVLGALVINGIFTKCGLERRFMSFLLRTFKVDGPAFLLTLSIGGMLTCGVLYSGSLVLMSALAPTLQEGVRSRAIAPNAAKRILLTVAFSSNAGSCLLPISSSVNLITIGLLGEFDYRITVETWAGIALPVATLTMISTWLYFMLVFRDDTVGSTRYTAASQEEAWQKQLSLVPTEHVRLTDWHLLFLGVGVLAVLGITVYADMLAPFIGHSACLSLATVVAVFGSGFMTREEFCSLDWDMLALVGGINVMAFLVRETGLGVELSAWLISHEIISRLPYQCVLLGMCIGAQATSTFLGHSITGVLILPLVVALGVKLQAPQITAIIVAIAIPFGMSMPSSSMDNIMSYVTSKKLHRRKAALTAHDFRVAGVFTSFLSISLLATLGFYISVKFYGTPATVLEAKASTPQQLKPKVVRENLPGPKDWEALELVGNRMSGRRMRRSSQSRLARRGLNWAPHRQLQAE